MLISNRFGDRVQSLATLVLGVLVTVGGTAAVIAYPREWPGWTLLALALGLGVSALGAVFLKREH